MVPATQSLQPFLQEKHADQVACGRGRCELRHRLALGRQSRLDAARAAPPGLDQRIRGRVVLLARLARDLLDEHRRQHLPRHPGVGQPAHEALLERALRAARGEFARGIDQYRRFHHLVDQSDGARGRCRQGAPGQHHVHCRRCSDQRRQAHAAAPAGIDAELHFRQADAGRGIARCHPIAAGQRELGAAAHAEAMDRGDRGTGQLGQSLEHLLSAPQRVIHRALGIERLELLDVGTGDEAAGLGRADHQTLGRIQCQALEDGVELEQDLLRQRVDRFARAIQRKHDDPVAAGLSLPMLEAQSIEASASCGTIRYGTGRPLSSGRRLTGVNAAPIKVS